MAYKIEQEFYNFRLIAVQLRYIYIVMFKHSNGFAITRIYERDQNQNLWYNGVHVRNSQAQNFQTQTSRCTVYGHGRFGLGCFGLE